MTRARTLTRGRVSILANEITLKVRIENISVKRKQNKNITISIDLVTLGNEDSLFQFTAISILFDPRKIYFSQREV